MATSTAAGSACTRVSGCYGDYSCLRNRWVVNRFGDLVLRTVNVCD